MKSFTSRPYGAEHDLLAMADLLMVARAATDDWRYAHVGELAWTFFMVACHLDPREHIRLWYDGTGRLAGYAVLGEDPAFDWQVAPAYEWAAGIEVEALAWAEARLAELRAVDPGRWGAALVSGARQDNAARIAFLEAHGFQPGGPFSEVNMLAALAGPIPDPTVPPGWQVRAVAEDEIAGRAAAQRAVWLPWSVGEVTDDDYAAFMRLPVYQRELDVVAVSPEGVIAAYVNGWCDPVNRIGDFGPVGALPTYRRQGLTRAVLLEALRRMRAAGMERVCVSTGVSNEAAWRLYESVGFRVVNRYLEYVRA